MKARNCEGEPSAENLLDKEFDGKLKLKLRPKNCAFESAHQIRIADKDEQLSLASQQDVISRRALAFEKTLLIRPACGPGPGTILRCCLLGRGR